jgi:hypothetical protein
MVLRASYAASVGSNMVATEEACDGLIDPAPLAERYRKSAEGFEVEIVAEA